jgi:phage gp36-like protein
MMSSYATVQQLINRFGEAELIQLTDRPTRADPENAGTIDADVIEQAIADADAEINSYLTAYTLPLAVVPANLVRIACDITRYYLYDDQMIDIVEARYKNAIRYLEQVAAGKIALGADTAGTTPPADSVIEFQSDPPVFGRM